MFQLNQRKKFKSQHTCRSFASLYLLFVSQLVWVQYRLFIQLKYLDKTLVAQPWLLVYQLTGHLVSKLRLFYIELYNKLILFVNFRLDTYNFVSIPSSSYATVRILSFFGYCSISVNCPSIQSELFFICTRHERKSLSILFSSFS